MDLDLTDFTIVLGPIVVAVIFNTFLYGICFNQFANYYVSRNKDNLAIKLFVSWELVIDTTQTAVSIYMLWLYFVANYANPAFLLTAPWPFTAIPIFTALSAAPIQLFLCWRVYLLSKSRLIFTSLSVLSVTQAVLAFTSGGTALSETELAGGQKYIPLVDSWLAVTVAADLSITASLIFFLARNRTGFHKTDHVITRLIRSAIESAAFATLFSILVLIVFTTFPNSTLSMVFSLPIGRIYTNTLLSTLNSRKDLLDTLNSSQYASFASRVRRHPQTTVNIEVDPDPAIVQEQEQDGYPLDTFKKRQIASEGQDSQS